MDKRTYSIIIFIIGILTFASMQFCYGQQDSIMVKKIKYTVDFRFRDGIYLNINQLKWNDPIPKERIISNLDFKDYNFFEKLLENNTIYVLDNMGMRKEIKTKDVWGFSQNGIVYVKWNDSFNRIPIFGNVCHFIADKTIVQNNYNNNYYNNYYNSYYSPYSLGNPYNNPYYQTSRKEIKQYILDMETGQIMDFTYHNIELILMRDPELYQEFTSLKKKKRKQLKFMYFRKYDEKHPFYILQKIKN